MKKEIECEIVQDLIPSYIEGLLSQKSNQLVEEHIQTCKECREKIQCLKENMKIENIQEKEIELQPLKRYHKKMKVLKIAFITILVILITSITLLGIRYFYHTNILNQIYNRYDEIRQLDNYCLKKQTIYLNYKTKQKDSNTIEYYYKNGKYKIINTYTPIEYVGYKQMQYINNDTIKYGDIEKQKQICIQNEIKKVEERSYNYIPIKKGDFFNTYCDIMSYRKIKNIFMNIGLSINTQKYKGQECYVITLQETTEEKKEVWISKSERIPLRIIEEVYESYYRETVFDLTINTVEESDITIPNISGYERKEQNIVITDEIMKSYYWEK